jgi:hypothetical protein
MDKEMMAALEADGEKLRQLTGEDHGPAFLSPTYDTAAAPAWYSADEASAWCAGWNACLRALGKDV